MKYPEQHDMIMASIRRRRDECVEELAAIEAKILQGKMWDYDKSQAEVSSHTAING